MGSKKGLSINQAWEYLAHLPIDIRHWTENIADLIQKQSYETYEGMDIYCDENKTMYTYNDVYAENATYGKFRPKQGYITKVFRLTSSDLVANTSYKYKIEDEDLFGTDKNYEKYKIEYFYTLPNKSIVGSEIVATTTDHYMLVEMKEPLTASSVDDTEILKNLKVVFTYLGDVLESNS